MKYTIDERKQHVLQQSVSGLKIARYCKEHLINYHTFKNWRRKYKSINNGNHKVTSRGGFVEVTSPRSAMGYSGTSIYLPNGVRLQVDREVDAGLLKLLSHV